MKIFDEPSVQLPKFGMDAPCVDLCNLLNRLPGVVTSESCCGHCKRPYHVFFRCDNLDTLTRLGRTVDRRYSDGKWEIVLDSGDSNPKNRFYLRSVEPFKNAEEMLNSVEELMDNILYWFDDKYDEYFDSDGAISDCTEQERSISWTTPRESQRLLVCGLSPETADATYVFSAIGVPHWDFVPTVIKPESEYDNQNTLPCWTLGKLFQILEEECDKSCKFSYKINGNEITLRDGISQWTYFRRNLVGNVWEAVCCLLKNKEKRHQKKIIVVLDQGHGK